MPQRKRLEDELRSVWAEWSTPHDYGLWHDHTVPGPVEAVEEAAGLIKGQEDAPAPIEVAPTSNSSAAKGGAAEASAAVGGGGSKAAAAAADATPAAKRKAGDPASPEAKLASALKKKVAIGSVKAALLNIGASRSASKVSKPDTDVPVVSHAFITADLQKGLVASPVQGLTHKTKQNPSGYPVHVMSKPADGPHGYKYFYYTDKAGSLRILRGVALSKAIKTMEERGAKAAAVQTKVAELRKRRGGNE